MAGKGLGRISQLASPEWQEMCSVLVQSQPNPKPPPGLPSAAVATGSAGLSGWEQALIQALCPPDRAGEPAVSPGGCPAGLPQAGRADPGRAR